MIYNEERPHSFDAMVGQKMTVESIRKQAIAEKFMGVYILYGQYGSGKTTMARIIALAANCPKDENGNPDLDSPVAKAILSGNCMDYMEVDGASNNGVEQVRALVENASFKPSYLKKKVYIIDEVHMLSNNAFNALLKTLEEPPEYAIFILCTTEHKAIPATVRSRAACYCFQKISDEDICGKLMAICEKRGISATKEGCMLIAKNSDGALRNAESILEQVAIAKDSVTEEYAREVLGVTDVSYVFEFVKELIKGNVGGAVKKLDEMLAEGKNLSYLVDDMLDVVSDSIIMLCSDGSEELIDNTSHYQQQLRELIKDTDLERMVSVSNKLMKLRNDIRVSESRTAFVVAIVSISGEIASKDGLIQELSAKIEELTKRVSELEKGNIVARVEHVADTVQKPMEQSMECSSADTVERSVSDDGYEHVAPGETPFESPVNMIEPEKVEPVQQAQAEITGKVLEKAETLKEPEPEVSKPKAPQIDFGGFGMFDSLFNLSIGAPVVSTSVNEPNVEKSVPKPEPQEEKEVELATGERSESVSEKASGIIAKVEKVAASNVAFFTAIHKGCRVEVVNDVVTYVTSLAPIKKLLDTYFDVFELDAVARVE